MSDILAAELAKAKAKLEYEKVHGREKSTKRESAPERHKGVEKRMARDDKYHVTKKTAQKSGYEHMQRKTELYRQFHEGQIDHLEGGVMERREIARDTEGGSTSRDSDGSHDSDSDLDFSEVEIVDEFGRTRTVPRRKKYLFEARKEVSRDGYDKRDVQKSRDMVERPANVIYGDIVQTGSFVKDDSIVIDEDGPSTSHYDSTKEIRNRGVGFMQFSQDAEVRARQQKELIEARAVTEAFVEEKKKEKERGEEVSELDRFRKRYEGRKKRVKDVYEGA